ncbi:hypothetical protein ACVIHA_007899 [Bradyrhizobium liaoningense]
MRYSRRFNSRLLLLFRLNRININSVSDRTVSRDRGRLEAANPDLVGVLRGRRMQRTSGPAVAAAIAVMIGGVQWARAGLLTGPRAPPALARIELGRPTLPPLTYTVFCLRYEAECRSRRSFRGGPIRLTETRWADLQEINRTVNQAIERGSQRVRSRRRRVDHQSRSWRLQRLRGEQASRAASARLAGARPPIELWRNLGDDGVRKAAYRGG